jgi:rubrerythrin
LAIHSVLKRRPRVAAPAINHSKEIVMSIQTTRRHFMGTSGTSVLSLAAVGLLSGVATGASAQSMDAGKDIAILNVALGLEHEAINAYQLGAGSNLLQKGVLDVAVLFQSHHKAHRDALIGTIEKLGGKAVMEKSLADYAKALGADGLKSQADVLMLAAKLELGAVNAYLGVIPAFKDAKLAQIAGRLAADETMHYTALKGALAQALPMGALSFGA